LPASAFATADRDEARNPQRFIHVTVVRNPPYTTNIDFSGKRKEVLNALNKEKVMTKTFFSATFVWLFCIGVNTAKAQALIDFETGAVSTGYNDVRIPGNNGTLFSLKNDLVSKTGLFYRIRLNYTVGSRHTFSLLYAPLETRSKGRVPFDIKFQTVDFKANTDVTGDYKFNSYRLTYRYDLVKRPRIEFGLGFTAKIRDARIALYSGDLTEEKVNVGFVPIINFRLLWNIDDTFGLLFEGDALAAPQGRAEDVQLAATYTLTERFTIRAGYRILEGGADNDAVYTFSLFHYAAVGLTYSFGNSIH
jgi:hypothetical protein